MSAAHGVYVHALVRWLFYDSFANTGHWRDRNCGKALKTCWSEGSILHL